MTLAKWNVRSIDCKNEGSQFALKERNIIVAVTIEIKTKGSGTGEYEDLIRIFKGVDKQERVKSGTKKNREDQITFYRM